VALIKAVLFHEECHEAKGRQTCSCFLGIAEICQLFYLATKMAQHIVFHLLLMRIPKWGLPFLYLLYFKRYCKKKEKFNFCEV
jgi:hypothetical protein